MLVKGRGLVLLWKIENFITGNNEQSTMNRKQSIFLIQYQTHNRQHPNPQNPNPHRVTRNRKQGTGNSEQGTGNPRNMT
jgi:hypothetical protein